MTSLEKLKRIVADSRALYDNAAMEFLQTLPLPYDVHTLALALETKAADPDYKFTSSALCASTSRRFPDYFKTSPTMDFTEALSQVKKRTEAEFPGAAVYVKLSDIGEAWVEIQVWMDLK